MTPANSEGPIGLFDSGVGGLTVAAHVLEKAPQEAILYYGDTARVPYGSRPLGEVRRYALDIGRYLVSQGAKAVVVACNTSTAAALESMRAELPVPVLGMVEHGVQAALSAARNGKIGVIATEGTVRSKAYQLAFQRARRDLVVVQQACPEFVPLVEKGAAETPEALEAARRYVGPLSACGIDTIVLGCTHYPYLSGVIRQVVGPEVTLVDPAEAVVLALLELLHKRALRRSSPEPPAHRFLVSGDPAAFATLATRLLGRETIVEKVDIFHAKS